MSQVDRHMLSVVIPAYNEEESISEVIARTLRIEKDLRKATESIQNIEIIVVDDGSKDRTAERVGKDPRVRLIRHQINQGYGSALKSGFEAARGATVAFLDADGTYPPEEFPRLCRALERKQADLVVASRMQGTSGRMPRLRYVGNAFFARLVSWLVGRPISDTASGMRVFRKEILARLLPLPDGLHLTPVMTVRAYHEGLKIIEVPIRYRERVGQSKLNVVTDGLRFLNAILRISRLYNPLRLFGAIGITMLTIGLWLGLGPLYYYLQVRRVEDTELYRLFTIMVFFITGINLITFGGLANYIVELAHGKAIRQHGVLSRILLSRYVLRWSGRFGLCLMFAAPVLNHRAIFEYLTTGRIYTHWVYVFTGATLFLIGLQLVMGSVLVAILREVKAARKVHESS